MAKQTDGAKWSFAVLSTTQKSKLADFMALMRKDKRTLVEYHDAALLLESVCENCSGYRSNWAESLSEFLESKGLVVSETQLSRLKKFATLYPGATDRVQIEELGDRIPWETMHLLFVIKDPSERAKMLRMVWKKKLSSRAVAALIKKKKEYRRSRNVPDPSPVESHPHLALKDLKFLASKWQLVSKAWLRMKDSAIKLSSQLEREAITVDLLADLEAAFRDVKAMAVSAGKLSPKLEELHTRLRNKRSSTA